MNKMYFILLLIPFASFGQTSPIFPKDNNINNRHWTYISGRDSLQVANGEKSKNLYRYQQENEKCASFFVDGKEVNVEIMPDTEVINVWNEEVYTTMFTGDLFPAILMGGELMILCKQGNSIFYYQQKLLKAKN